MIRRHIALILAMSLPAGRVWSAEETSTIDIIAITISGDSISSGVVDLIDPATGQSLKSQFRGFHGSGVPHGEYILRVRVPGFKNHEQRLRIFQAHAYSRIGLLVARITDEEPLRLSGVLTPVPKRGDELWVKLIPVLTSVPTMDTAVGPDGRFEFAGMEIGQYMVLVVRGTECVATKQVNTSMTSVQIAVPSR